MRHVLTTALAVAACAWATPALADSAPSNREVQSAVDAYLGSAKADATLVGGPGQAGYDNGFWIRGGSFLMKINLTLQARWEGFDWDEPGHEPRPGGDLSGFSLPRATLKFSGDATCDVHYYAELEFGHSGHFLNIDQNRSFVGGHGLLDQQTEFPFQRFEDDYGTLREAWIEYETCPWFIFRMGLVKTPTTRQMMTPPELQQFVDVSMASAVVGTLMPGYTDRNRDYGAMMHGSFGCDGEFQYMLAITNGDGPVHRNVLDGTTSDNFAYSARLNWDIKGHLGYEEGALRSNECDWAASLGAWAHYYADHRQHMSFSKFADRLTWGVDGAFVWGGLSLTAAYSAWDWENESSGFEAQGFSYLVQAGYLFPGTAWEIAARYTAYEAEINGNTYSEATEIGFAVTYYIDGHADKVTLDVAMIDSDSVNFFADTYAGYNATRDDENAILIRLQWQLAL